MARRRVHFEVMASSVDVETPDEATPQQIANAAWAAGGYPTPWPDDVDKRYAGRAFIANEED
jgi:hypothetical protein